MTLDDIIVQVGEDVKITVDITPDGHGDAVRTVNCNTHCLNMDVIKKAAPSTGLKKMFVKPHEQKMSLDEFRRLLRSSNSITDQHVAKSEEASDRQVLTCLGDDGLEIYPVKEDVSEDVSQEDQSLATIVRNPVVYYSRQNDCLRTEMRSLFSTGMFPTTFPFAEEAFATGPPDAINLWIGNERSVSSMHKDHYENLFYVCSGRKEFILSPPADILFKHEREFASGKFCPSVDESGSLCNAYWTVEPDHNNKVEEDETMTRWIEPNIERYMNGEYTRDQFPLLSKSHPIKVVVSQGEMLYIPSLWLHQVTQTCETVGVNFWYDMKFDSAHWCYFNFLQQMKRQRENY